MERTYWHKQTAAEPLFGGLLWSRPENKLLAGKLLIVGGNGFGFAAPAAAYAASLSAGAGAIRVALPQSLKKTVGQTFAAGEYLPATPSGSFSMKALAGLADAAAWADGVLLAGDFGANSETAIMLEKFLDNPERQVTLCGDAVDIFLRLPDVLNRDSVCLVLSLTQLQKLAASTHFDRAFTSQLDLMHMVENLHMFGTVFKPAITLEFGDHICVELAGEVSTTPSSASGWPVRHAALMAVWRMQFPSQPFQALTTAAFLAK